MYNPLLMQKCDCVNLVFSVMPLYDYILDWMKITKKLTRQSAQGYTVVQKYILTTLSISACTNWDTCSSGSDR